MKQLLMVWYNAPIALTPVADGYRFHVWRRGGDEMATLEEYKRAWIDMRAAEGVEAITNWFDVVYDDPRVPDDGFYTVFYGSELVATSCIQFGEHTPDSATVHAVAASPAHKGKRLGRIITEAVMEQARRRGIEKTYLTTDDWRIAAVKIYLDLGFRPVLWDTDMRERWQKLLDHLGRRQVPAVDEEGKDILLAP